MRSDDRLAAGGDSHIRELIGRIDAARAAAHPHDPVAGSFRWETCPDGVILWVEGAPRGPLVGRNIAGAEASDEYGPDAYAARNFARRMPFRDARFSVPGSGPASGEWRLSGVPFFHSGQGHFLGYRGSARRPSGRHLQEGEGPAMPQEEPAGGLFGTALAPDSLRQLIHELRTPINAITGFAEMIEGQYLGPAADAYRARASRIREQAGQLLSAVEDLDTAATMQSGRSPQVEQTSVDLADLLYRLDGAYDRAGEQYATLRLEFAPDLPLARVEPAAAERMVSRMLAATIGHSEEGERLSASVWVEHQPGGAMLCLAISKPRSLLGVEEAQLLDPGFAPPGHWPAAPALGLGFALRLARNLAEAAGGALAIDPDRFLLALPPLEPARPS